MDYKTFVLLPTMDATAPIFQQVQEGQRIRLTRIPRHRPHLQVTFTNEEGKNKTLRYKSNTDKIWQDEQIKDGILANDKFTNNERNDPYFRNGVLVTNKPTLINFLLAHPEHQGFKGICDDVREPTFKMVDKAGDMKSKNTEFNLRVDAAVKIKNLQELKDAQDLLLRLNGTWFTTPDDLDECKDLLIDFLDNAEEAGLKAILKEPKDLTVDEKTHILVGKMINAGKLSFDVVEGKVCKKDRDGKWIEIRDIPTTFTADEKARMFTGWLNTMDGVLLMNDFEIELGLVSDEDLAELRKLEEQEEREKKAVAKKNSNN